MVSPRTERIIYCPGFLYFEILCKLNQMIRHFYYKASLYPKRNFGRIHIEIIGGLMDEKIYR